MTALAGNSFNAFEAYRNFFRWGWRDCARSAGINAR